MTDARTISNPAHLLSDKLVSTYNPSRRLCSLSQFTFSLIIFTFLRIRFKLSIKKNSTITTQRRKYDERATAVCDLGRILRNGRGITATLGHSQSLQSSPTAPQLLGTALEKVPTRPSRARHEDTSDTLADWLVSEDLLI